MFKDLSEGQTHYNNDGCGVPAHNPSPNKGEEKWEEEFEKVMGCIPECKNGLYEDVGCPAHGYDAIKAKKFIKEKLIQAKSQGAREALELAMKELTVDIDKSVMLDGWEKYWVDAGDGRYIEGCIECENTKRIKTLIRKEAMHLQKEAGIPSLDPGGYRGDELYSEDLY